MEARQKPVVAVVFDFDDTLAPDSTSQLLAALGVDVPGFWRDEVRPLIRSGWDPVPAYLYRMLELGRAGRFNQPLVPNVLRRIGGALELYPGVPDLFERLWAHVDSVYPDVQLEFYVISSGLQAVVESSAMHRDFTRVWACDLYYDPITGVACYPRNIVSFTDKTRYLFHINKGLIAPRCEQDPFEVNRRCPPDELRVPFDRMIYVGDGHTDVPCFSLVTARGGIALAVVDADRQERWGRAWGFLEDRRALNLCPTDYREGSAADMVLKMALQTVCERIQLEARTFQS